MDRERARKEQEKHEEQLRYMARVHELEEAQKRAEEKASTDGAIMAQQFALQLQKMKEVLLFAQLIGLFYLESPIDGLTLSLRSLSMPAVGG